MVQVNNTPIILRVKFKKVGRLQYISHLDLVRTMHKIIVRAGLPLWYTEGFNPKPKMVFAAPLSTGTESTVEFVDIRLTERMPTEDALARLSVNMTEEMQPLAAYYPTSKLTDLKWFSYDFLFHTKNATAHLAARCEEFLLSDTVLIQRRSKSGDTVTVDIRPLIKSVSTVLDGEDIKMNAVLSGDASAYLSPEHVVRALSRELGILSDPDLTSEYYSIMRNSAHLADMSEFL